MIKKFIIRKSPKFKEYKLKPVKPKVKQFTTEASMLRKEAAEKIARRAEYSSLEKGMLKIRSVADKMIVAGTNKNMKRKIDKAGIQAFKTARAKGVRTLQKTSDKLGVGIRRFGSQKVKTLQKLSDAEARELGFPPREVFKSVGKKGPMSKLDRAIDTYSRAEKMNPRTGKFETFRKYDVRPIDPVASFYRKKRK